MDCLAAKILKLCNSVCVSLRVCILIIIGIIKAAIFGTVAALVILVGNSGITLLLWPAHVVCTYYCFARAKHLGPLLKCVIMIGLVVPLILYPTLVLVGSLLVGIAYGMVTPIVDTLEAMNEEWRNKYVQCIVSGTWSTVKASYTVVLDFKDVCYHSYFDYMNEFKEKQPRDGQPLEIKLLKLPGCLLVGILGMLVDAPIITLLAIWKSPCMLLKGWKRLILDLVGREGMFSVPICLPFSTCAILFWPSLVILAIIAASISSFFLGFYSAIVAYQEDSILLGFTYSLSAVSLFDEYTNDLLYMREGSCFPRCNFCSVGTLSRPSYRYKTCSRNLSKETSCAKNNDKVGKQENNSVLQRSGTEKAPSKRLSKEIRHAQIWDQIFQSSEFYGCALVQEGVIKISDLQQWLRTGKCKIIGTGLPAYSILQIFVSASKTNSDDFFLSEIQEVTKSDTPVNRVLKWFMEPLMIIKEQIKVYELHECEVLYLSNLVLSRQQSQNLEACQNGDTAPMDEVRKAELEALCRRLQGITASLSRMPTFRRRYQNVVRVLLQLALCPGINNFNETLPKTLGESMSNRQFKSNDRMSNILRQQGRRDVPARPIQESTKCTEENV